MVSARRATASANGEARRGPERFEKMSDPGVGWDDRLDMVMALRSD